MLSSRLGIHLIALCILQAVAVTPIQSRSDSQLEARTVSSDGVNLPSLVHAETADDMLGSVMRREAFANNVDTAVDVPTAAKGFKPAALEQLDSRRVHMASSTRANQSQTAGSQLLTPPTPPESIVQALSRELLNIPESQKPVYAAAFLMVFGAAGFLFYALLSMKSGRNERDSAIRRKFMSMGAATGIPDLSMKGFNPALKGSSKGVIGASLPKGFGKGKGKLVGKGSLKGSTPSSKGFEQSDAFIQQLPFDVMGLAMGKRSKGPGSVSSIASSQTDGVFTSVSQALAHSSASTWTSPEDAQDRSESKVSGRGKEVQSTVSDLLAMLRSVEKIQRAWRSWKANQTLPCDGQRITFLCDVLEGEHMPNVNRFGGCDPFVECRIVKSDPSNQLRGDLDTPALLSAQTDVRRNEMAPKWGQRLVLPDLIYEKGLFVQLALWDYNLSRSQPIGHVAMPIDRALTTHGTGRPPRVVEVAALPGVEVAGLQAKVSIQCSYRETFRYRLIVASGSQLPQAAPSSILVPSTKLASSLPLPSEVEQPNAISSYIEARVLSDDPRKAHKVTQCLWSGRTRAQEENGDPIWNQEFEFHLDSTPESAWLQLLLWDANSILPNSPLGHAVLEMTQVNCGWLKTSYHHDLVDHALQFEDVLEHHSIPAFSNSTVLVRIGCDLAMSPSPVA